MEAIPWAWVVASNPRRIGLISAPILLHVCHDFRRDFCHDRAAIGLRSGVNHDARASSIACRSMGDKSAPIPRQNLLDRAAIAARSRRDRGVLPQSSTAVRLCSNWMDDRDWSDPVRRDREANLLLAVRWRSSGLKASSHLL